MKAGHLCQLNDQMVDFQEGDGSLLPERIVKRFIHHGGCLFDLFGDPL